MNPKLNSHPVVRDFFWLTRYTNPYGTEVKRFGTRLESLGATQDAHGNFFLDIGKSRTVFAAHLDTADSGKDMKRVHRIVNGDIIKTDGQTILGADDRAGLAVMLHLIRNQIPGRYAFFVGEESGRIGSEASALHDKWFWEGKFDRMIMWDRYGTNSIITYQTGVQTASETFAATLAAMYDKAASVLDPSLSPIYLMPDDGGIYTDSFSFIDLIPECTNISIGYMNQHTRHEYQDARFLVSMAEASVNVAWEDLPVYIDMKNREDMYPVQYWNNKGVSSSKSAPWDDTADWWANNPKWDRDIGSNTFRPIHDMDDLIDHATYGTLMLQDVKEFIWNNPEEAAGLLHNFLTGNPIL